jgi:uncharacterized protein with HEPN domain
MSRRDAKLLIADILEAIAKIKLYTQSHTFETFIRDSKTIDAVIRNFEVIGEAANRLPENFKDNHPQIEGFRIRGFRNRIVHDYMGIDYNIIWTIIENNLDQLDSDLQKIYSLL